MTLLSPAAALTVWRTSGFAPAAARATTSMASEVQPGAGTTSTAIEPSAPVVACVGATVAQVGVSSTSSPGAGP